MILFGILIAFYVVAAGAVLGRIDGSGDGVILVKDLPEWVERSLIMFFFVMACAPFAGAYALFSYAGVVGIATGHGQYFLSRAVKYMGRKPDGSRGTSERVDPFVRLFFGQDPRTDTKFNTLSGAAQTNAIRAAMNDYGMTKLYWRCVFGMFATGTLVGLPALVVSVSFGAYLPAVFFALTGVVKALAYMIGYKIFNNTESAEYINGGGRNVLCLLAITFALIGV